MCFHSSLTRCKVIKRHWETGCSHRGHKPHSQRSNKKSWFSQNVCISNFSTSYLAVKWQMSNSDSCLLSVCMRHKKIDKNCKLCNPLIPSKKQNPTFTRSIVRKNKNGRHLTAHFMISCLWHYQATTFIRYAGTRKKGLLLFARSGMEIIRFSILSRQPASEVVRTLSILIRV